MNLPIDFGFRVGNQPACTLILRKHFDEPLKEIFTFVQNLPVISTDIDA